jgi:hypothetical protein
VELLRENSKIFSPSYVLGFLFYREDGDSGLLRSITKFVAVFCFVSL